MASKNLTGTEWIAETWATLGKHADKCKTKFTNQHKQDLAWLNDFYATHLALLTYVLIVCKILLSA
jgi:hypothetical protein